MNPNLDGEERPKLATQIAENEDWKETQSDPEDLEEKKAKKMKIGPLEFDSTYVMSLPGIMRIVQIVSSAYHRSRNYCVLLLSVFGRHWS